MKISKKIATIFVSVTVMIATVISICEPAFAEMNIEKDLNGIIYNKEGTAKAKAYFAALTHCYYNVGDDDDRWTMAGALSGQWLGDGDDGIGADLDDDFLHSIRGDADDTSYDCDESNYIIKEAFDFFHTISGEFKSWDQFTLEDKMTLYCGTTDQEAVDTEGWGHASIDGSGGWGDDSKGHKCAYNLWYIANNSSMSDANSYVFRNTYNAYDGMAWLKDYINKNYFKNKIDISTDYDEAETYYLWYEMMYKWCGGGAGFSTAQPPSGDYGTTVRFNYAKNSDAGSDYSLTYETVYTYLKHTKVSAEYDRPNNLHKPTKTESYKCPAIDDKVIGSLSQSSPTAAKNNLVDYLKNGCVNYFYDGFYNKQKEYYNGLTDAEKKGEKKDYAKWFTDIKVPPEDSTLYKINDDNPLFQCLSPEYVKKLMDSNPDPDSPAADEYNPGVPGSESGSDAGDASSADPNCYTNSGALGWIVCPIIEMGGSFIESFYANHIVPLLVMDSALLNTKASAGNMVYGAWTTFQGFANIAFVALFLLVIFSQVTGVGIDNYGIKKILPKLIVAAIMINLSYIICQLAVDLANIVGYGVQQIFEGIGHVDEYNITLTDEGLGTYAATGASAVIIVAIVAAITASAILSLGAGVLVPVVLAIISFVIAFVTLFILLALRKAMAVVLVIISPCAFLMYMLPNTKGLFKRWVDMFKTVLLAFPICNAMIYGGQAVARIMLGANSSINTTFSMALAAAAMSVAPIFFIPSVLRKSLGAIGALTNAARSRFTHAARAGAMGTRGMKSLQRRGEMHRQARQTEFEVRGAQRRERRRKAKGLDPSKMSAAQRRQVRADANIIAGHRKETQEAYGHLFSDLDSSDIAANFKNIGDDVASGKVSVDDLDDNMIIAGLQSMADRGDYKEMNDALRGLASSGFIDKLKTTDAGKKKLKNIGVTAAGAKSQNVIAGLYGKALASGSEVSFSDFMKDGTANGFAAKLQQENNDVLVGQDHSTMQSLATLASSGAIAGYDDGIHGPRLMTEAQAASTFGNLSNKAQPQMGSLLDSIYKNNNLGGRAFNQRAVSEAKIEQAANIDEATACALRGVHGTTDATLQEGARRFVRNTVGAAKIADIRNNKELASKMTESQKRVLGIT